MAIINGTNGNNTLTGTLGDDIINALGGNDTINASQGNDSIDGGTGLSDRLVINTFDTSLFAAATASRTYLLTASTVSDSSGNLATSFADIERITLSTAGNGDFGDTIDASGFVSAAVSGTVITMTLGNGNDIVIGSNHSDFIDGRLGSNIIDAGGGEDNVVARSDNRLSLVQYVTSFGSTVVTTENGVVTNQVTNAEIVRVGGSYAHNSFADGLTTRVDASGYLPIAGVQLLFDDHNGDDIFIGSSGADIFGNTYTFTVGNDTYTGNGGADIYDYTVAINALNNDVITDFDNDDTIDFQFNDGIIAGQLRCEFWIGAAEFSGVVGQYRYEASGGQTFVQIDTDGDAIADRTLTLSNGQFALGETLSGSNVITMIGQSGTSGDDFLVGTLGDDQIYAQDGDDTIAATGGMDHNYGGAGYDQLRFITANTDRFVQPWASRTVTITNDWVGASDGTINSYHDGIESLFLRTTGTGDYGDTIDASALTTASLILRLGAGNDIVIGGSGDDDIGLALGINTANAGAGYDIVYTAFDNYAGDTAYVTNVGGTVILTVGGMQMASIVNGEEVHITGFYASGVTTTIDASGFAPIAGVTLVLRDSNGSDVIIGSSGSDYLSNVGLNSLGSDSFTGNGGADVFDWTYASDNINGDIITDFDSDDTLDFRFNDGTVAGASPLLCTTFIGRNAFSGTAGEYRYEWSGGETRILVDTDGDGVGDQTLTIANGEFELVETAAGSNQLKTVGQIINGTNGNNILEGTSGHDVIYALAGRDTIYATQGNDYIDGGPGNDTLGVRMWNGTYFPNVSNAPHIYVLTNENISAAGTGLNSTFASMTTVFLNLAGTSFGDTVDSTAFTGGFNFRAIMGDGDDHFVGGAASEDVSTGHGYDVLDMGAGAGFDTARVNIAPGATNAVITGSGDTAEVYEGGVLRATITGAEMISINEPLDTFGVDGLVHYTDASGYTGSAVVLHWDHNGDDVMLGSTGSDIFANLYNATVGNDTYTGNGGADIYDYTVAINALNNDVITDFDSDDIIDFQFNDGFSVAGQLLCNQWIGRANFTGVAGQYRYEAIGGNTYVQIDTDGNGVADRTLTLNGVYFLAETAPGSNQLRMTGQQITGTTGDDTLNGTPGDDILVGLAGNDQLWGGAGNDTTSYAAATGGVQVTLYNGGGGDAAGADGADQLHDIENVTGSAFNDSITGNNLANVLIGGDGHDFLQARGGNDTVLAGSGDDYVGGGAGDDYLDGGDGVDRATFFNGSTGPVTVDLRLQGVAQNTGLGFDTLVNIENVSGTGFGDTLIGDGGDNYLWGASDGSAVDTIDGQGGNDLIETGAGNHILTGGTGTDTFLFNPYLTIGGGTISLALQGAAQNTGAGLMTLTGFENLSGSDYADTLTGDGAANLLAGGGGDDSLIGGGGNDALYGDGMMGIDNHGTGLSGAITLFPDVATLGGVDGNDLLAGGLGNDQLFGGGGTDTASYANASGAVTVSLQTGTSSGADGNDTLDSIENLIGSNFNDILTGDMGANSFSAGLGNSDRINGSQGADFVDGGTGASDRLHVSTGNAGLFTLATGARTYIIGANSITDSSGTLNTSFTGIELITFSTIGNGNFDDVIDASGYYSPRFTSLDISVGNGDNQITGSSGNDRISTGFGNNIVDGGAGYDTGISLVDSSISTTVTVTSVGNTVSTTANGVTNILTNCEEVWVMGSGAGAITLDASGYVAIPGVALVLVGHDGSDTMIGSAGNDFFANITGQVLGTDIYTGNGGADIYDYTYAADSMNGDTITDFDIDDVIDMRFNNLEQGGSPLLANHFIGAAAFSGTAGEYRYQINGTQTVIQLDSDGNMVADQTVTISNGAFMLAETFAGSNILTLASVIDGLDGVVADGYLAGATLFIDVDGDGLLGAGEAWTVTDAAGNFSLNVNQAGTMVAFGGINIDTGLANTMTLAAPSSSGVVNPITTLIQAVIEQGATAAAAEAQVKQALGLDPTLDLLNLDLIAAAAIDPDALAAQKAAALVANLVAAVEGTAGAGATAEAALMAALADLVADAGAGGIDLTSAATLTPLLTQALPGVPNITALAGEVALQGDAIAAATSVDAISDAQYDAQTVDYSGDNTRIGDGYANFLYGLSGNDDLYGLGGNDTLVGGDGLDHLWGGSGADLFVAEATTTKSATKVGNMSFDVIFDFARGSDKIDLGDLDANALIAGHQAFNWKGSSANKGAADLSFKVYASVQGAERALGIDIDGVAGASPYSGPVTIVFGNIDGGNPDFALALIGVNGVTASDFLFS